MAGLAVAVSKKVAKKAVKKTKKILKVADIDSGGSVVDVEMYTTKYCPYCVRARHLLDSKGVLYNEISVDGQYELRQQMMERSGQRTVPQIWVGAQHIGGCDELMALERQGQLDQMLMG